MAEYKNPFTTGPKYFTGGKLVTEYLSYLIYQRWDKYDDVFDVVKDGVCITQLAGLNGAKRAIEKLVCDHAFAYSGNMPCTGVYRCVRCGFVPEKDHMGRDQ